MSEGTGYLGPDDVARSRIQATSVPAGGGEVGGEEGTVPPVAWLALARLLLLMVAGAARSTRTTI
jgi:hypothetical protein